MKIGNYNLFEADCTITSSDIGDSNDFSFKCFVDDNCRIGNFCQVGPKVVLQGGSRLTDYTVMYDDNRSKVMMLANRNIIAKEIHRYGNMRH